MTGNQSKAVIPSESRRRDRGKNPRGQSRDSTRARGKVSYRRPQFGLLERVAGRKAAETLAARQHLSPMFGPTQTHLLAAVRLTANYISDIK
jgi:hypothetical protein